jgi:pimeloyl-ACP methyl ester carboxylesterase
MPTVTGTNGDPIHYNVTGAGPNIFLGYPFTASQGNADGLPVDLRADVVEPLSQRFRVITADYPRGIGETTPVRAHLLTIDNVAREIELIADAAGADSFAWWGYSWGALVGLYLACMTSRLTCLVTGGWPPLAPLFSEMLDMCRGMEAELSRAAGVPGEVVESVAGFRMFYEDLVGRDWGPTQISALSLPRLTYVGDKDLVSQGGIDLPVTSLWMTQRAELDRLGWRTHLVEGDFGHDAVIEASHLVLPVITTFLASALDATSA